MNVTPFSNYVFRERSTEIEEGALGEGFTRLQAILLSGRLRESERTISSIVAPPASELDTPKLLPDILAASSHIADAIDEKRPIAIVTDHDADGATSHAIIRLCLLAWGVDAHLIGGFLSHRMREGYGISEAFVDRILPLLEANTCIITADQGSTDEARIARLRFAGHVVVVTDHHGLPESGPPLSAHAVVNPVRSDSLFPDRSIAGCHTALLVMAAVREELITRGSLPSSAAKASDYIDLCAIGTVADAASLGASRNNRAIIQMGLKLMNRQPRACWQALRRVLGKEGEWTTSDIAFQLATRINARGRVSDAMLSVEFLVCDDVDVAHSIALELDVANRERREIERTNTRIAVDLAREEVVKGRFGLCLWLGENGHSGVHGICASRIVERFGRPTICISPMSGSSEFVTGSARSTDRVNVKDTFAKIQNEYPELLLGAGGHAGAGGLRLRRADIPRLVEAWDEFVRRAYADELPSPVVFFDGDIERPTLSHVEEIAELEPYGRGFEPPVFFGEWLVKEVRAIGDGTHIKMVLVRGTDNFDAVWFSAKEADAPAPISVGQVIRAAYTVESNYFRGISRLQLQIKSVAEAE